jgi:class 3 adenylate cyclase
MTLPQRADTNRTVAVAQRRLDCENHVVALNLPDDGPGAISGMHALHRTVLAVDVEGFGDLRRTNVDRQTVRDALYRILQKSFSRSGIPRTGCRIEDRGDGVLVFALPEIPKALFIESLPRHLITALREHNIAHSAPARIRLRIALHAGEMRFDDHGATGTSINLTFRLLDSPELKSALARSPGVLALIVSAWFFDEVVRNTPASTPDAYREVYVSVKETDTSAWILVPGDAKMSDREALKYASKDNRGWDILYYAKRIWQVNSTDVDAALAVNQVQADTLRYHDTRGSTKDDDKGNVNPFFEHLGPNELKEVLQLGQLIERVRGDMICRYNDSGDTMFVILRGEVGVFNSEGRGFNDATEPRYVLGQGEIVGELAYALARNRTADLVAHSDVALLSFSYQDIQSKSPVPVVASHVAAYIDFRVLQHVSDNAPYLLGPERTGPLSVGAPTWDYALTVLRQHSDLINVGQSEPNLTLDVLQQQVSNPMGLYILVAGVLTEQRSGSRLRGVDFPVLWVEVPSMLGFPQATYEVHQGPVKVLYIAARDIDVLRAPQRAALRRALAHAFNRQTSEYPFDVFLCHSKKDTAVVSKIYRRLNAAGITCWFDERQTQPGTSTTDAIEEGVATSSVLLACISSNFADRNWKTQELAAALRIGTDKRVLVLLLDGDGDGDGVIPLPLRNSKRLNYARDDDFEELIRYITSARAD